MAVIFVTTTGLVKNVNVKSLSDTIWPHPVVNKPLNGTEGEYSDDDVKGAFKELISLYEKGEIIITNSDGVLLKENSSNPFNFNNNFYGSQYHYAESEATSTTTSILPQTKLRMTIPNLPEGKYRINYYFEISNSSTNGVVVSRVEYDNPPHQIKQIIIQESSFEPDDTNIGGYLTQSSTDDEWSSVSGFKSNMLLKGTANFYIKFLDAENGVSAIRRARLELIRIA